MKQDKKWQEENLVKFIGLDGHAMVNATNFAEAYAVHMVRWRPMSELPDEGERVEVLRSELGEIHTIIYDPARLKDTDLGWRHALPLPTVTEP